MMPVRPSELGAVVTYLLVLPSSIKDGAGKIVEPLPLYNVVQHNFVCFEAAPIFPACYPDSIAHLERSCLGVYSPLEQECSYWFFLLSSSGFVTLAVVDDEMDRIAACFQHLWLQCREACLECIFLLVL